MLLIIVGMGFFIIILSLLMFTVARVRPENFVVRVKLAKLISLDIEIRLPRLVPGTRGRRQNRPADDKRAE
jgi:hypothetical protein